MAGAGSGGAGVHPAERPALRRLPTQAASAPARTPAVSLRPLAWTLAAYTCFGIGYIAYMTFIVAFLKGAGAQAWITPFWALLGLSVVLHPFVWAPVTARLRGARAMTAQMLTLAAGAALPLLGITPPRCCCPARCSAAVSWRSWRSRP